jgi:plastocyanin
MLKVRALAAILAVSVLAPLSAHARIDTVNTSGLTFVPATLLVHYGDTVRWVNPSGIHTTTSDVSSTKTWNSGTLSAGQHFDVVFTAGDGPGPFDYLCTFHSSLGMTGTINAAPPSCCVGKRGNVNMTSIVDLSDLSSLVSFLTGGGFVLPCVDAANVNGSGIIDLSDLSALVSFLTGGGFVLPNCP